MSIFKRYISLLLVMLILVGVFAPATQAAPAEETATVNTDGVTVEGTNGFGSLLTQEINQSHAEAKEEASEYSGGYTVTDLEIENGVATVTYDSMEEATLVVALYTEDGMRMVNSAKTTVTPDATEITVTFEGEMPEYFLASAYLMDSYDLEPETVKRHHDVAGDACPAYYVDNGEAWNELMVDIGGEPVIPAETPEETPVDATENGEEGTVEEPEE